MITETGISVGGGRCAADRLISEDVAVCLRRIQKHARNLHQALSFARNIDNG